MTELGNSLAADIHVPESAGLLEGLCVYFTLCGFLIAFLWTRVFAPRTFTGADTAFAHQFQKKLENVESEVRNKVTNDQFQDVVKDVTRREEADKADKEAWDRVWQQLNPRLPEFPLTELQAKIAKANETTQEKIFQEVVMRRSGNWNNKELVARTIPIFKAFTEHDPKRSEYHGELGFALKDTGAFGPAIEELSLAINNRPKRETSGAAWYEYLRAVCRIKLDKNLPKRQPSAERQAIHDDLKIAWDSHLKEAMGREKGPELKSWIKVNGFENEFPEAEMNTAAAVEMKAAA